MRMKNDGAFSPMACESSSRRRSAVTRNAQLALLAALFSWTCARNPVTGKKELMLVSEGQEIQMGREAAQAIPVELGLVEDREIGQRVARLGGSIARNSERPALPWEFQVVDSPVVNAFALPGGWVYLTRGILAHMNSDAEMAGVLGHEVGHITIRHSAQQISRSQLTGLGLGLGMIFVPEIRPYGDLLQSGLGLLFLKFGRDDETEADRVGVRYAVQSGYDPRQMAAFFDVLDRMRSDGDGVLPTWLSTHPDPADRESRILDWAREAAPDPSSLTVGEESFKRALEGMTFGENPREGFMDGNVFKHPEMRFQIEFPPGFRVENTRRAVYAGSGDSAFQLMASRVSGEVSPSTHAFRVFQRGGLEVGPGRSLTIGGFAAFVAPFRAGSASSPLGGEAAFIRDGETIYELFAYTSAGAYRQRRGALLDILSSFSRLRDPRALGAQPQRIRLYRVLRETSAKKALLDSGVVPDQLDEIALMNHLLLETRVGAGTLLKTVTKPAIPVATQ
jgi:predicted Zn-dependent protease